MVVILRDGPLNGYLESFSGNNWKMITASLDAMSPATAEVSLPKFKFDFDKVLNEQLKSLSILMLHTFQGFQMTIFMRTLCNKMPLWM